MSSPSSCDQSTELQSISCPASCAQNTVEPCTSVHPADTRCYKSTDRDSQGVSGHGCAIGTSAACSQSCGNDCNVGSDERVMNAATLAHPLLETEHQSSVAGITDTNEIVDVSSAEHWPASSDPRLCPITHQRLVPSNVHEPDLNVSLDSCNCGILSAETESEPAVGFSECDAEYETSTQTESFHQTTSSVDTITNCRSDAMSYDVAADSIVTELSGKPGVRCILTASLSEVSQPAEETVTHIGSTHVHVTDELSVVNGVVQPIESGVKIGEMITLCILFILTCCCWCTGIGLAIYRSRVQVLSQLSLSSFRGR